MAFINQAVTVLQTLVIALGAGLAVWGVVNLMEGYGNDNPGAKGAGIKRHITFHDLRHTHVTSLLEADISVNTVAERIGHAYASTTFDIYGHVLKRAKERASEICCDFGS